MPDLLTTEITMPPESSLQNSGAMHLTQTDRDLLAVLPQVAHLSESECFRLVTIWQKSSSGATLFDFSVRANILSPHCLPTLRLATAGAVRLTASRSLFAPGGLHTLYALLGIERPLSSSARRKDTIKLEPRRLQRSAGKSRPLTDNANGEVRASVRRTAGRKSPSPKPAETPFELKPGATLGKCQLLRELGHGTSCRVFEALHLTLQSSVAIKVFVDHDGKGDRTHLQEFSKEARLLAQFAHPNIVRILDFEEGDLPFLVLEFVRGFTAKQLLDQSGQLAPLQSVQTARDAAQALAYAHNRGLVHRDVKPDNLMVDMDGNLKLADLGISKLQTSLLEKGWQQTHEGLLCGTPAYIAPEQIFSPDEVDHRADIYSLGATLYHCLTGQLPVSGKTLERAVYSHINGTIPSPKTVFPEVPDTLNRIILRMMDRDPDKRFQTMTEMAEVLNEACEDLLRARRKAMSTSTIKGLTRQALRDGFSQIIRRKK